jgi:dihydroneopterin aldolase
MDRLILRELHFLGRHGVLPVEAEQPQAFSATLELEFPAGPAGRSDRLADTVDYCAVQAVVRSVIEGPHRRLIEALAETIAAELLRAFPRVQAVTVEVAKPNPPVTFPFASLAIRIRRVRSG